jgi:hypothetical protein
MQQRWLVVLLLILNAVVLLGQLWPEGAPPFARTVNVAFLTINLGFLIFALKRRP